MLGPWTRVTEFAQRLSPETGTSPVSARNGYQARLGAAALDDAPFAGTFATSSTVASAAIAFSRRSVSLRPSGRRSITSGRGSGGKMLLRTMAMIVQGVMAEVPKMVATHPGIPGPASYPLTWAMPKPRRRRRQRRCRRAGEAVFTRMRMPFNDGSKDADGGAANNPPGDHGEGPRKAWAPGPQRERQTRHREHSG